MKNKILLTSKEIAKITKGKLLSGREDRVIESFEIDSRRLSKGQGFIAFKGISVDGHDYIKDAYNKGCRFFIISRAISLDDFDSRAVFIKVKDADRALFDIARLKRSRSQAKVIAVTGSCGKTTTKEMIAGILSAKYKVLKNIGNFNNHYGLPLTLLKLRRDHQIVVLEMGMNHAGEIKRLNALAQAEVGVITCIHPVHLEFFKGIKDIALAKWELIRTLKKEKIAVVNFDSSELKTLSRKSNNRVISFAINAMADYKADDIVIENNYLRFTLNRKQKIKLNLLGGFNIYNALAAIAVVRQFAIDYDIIKNKLKSFRLPKLRMQRIVIDNIEFINDGYNANPKSVELAIESLCQRKTKGKKIIVLGDMLELGKNSRRYHEHIGKLIAKSGIDLLITFGEYAGWFCEAAKKGKMEEKNIFFLKNKEEVVGLLRKKAKKGDAVLLKGSRLMKTEEIVECFMNSYTP
jgi:UDP-N-acetylmuramoyl-tripeptide--D-alanyl-D-alanine ligase